MSESNPLENSPVQSNPTSKLPVLSEGDTDFQLRHWFGTKIGSLMSLLRIDALSSGPKIVTFELSKNQITGFVDELEKLSSGLEKSEFIATPKINKVLVDQLITFIKSLDYNMRVLTLEEVQLIGKKFEELFS